MITIDSDDNTIIKKINEHAPNATEEELDLWIVPELISHYSNKISWLATKAYGHSAVGSSVASLAFKERAKAEIRSATNTFLFKSEHWKTGRDINSYLITCLNRLADRINWDSDNVKKYNSPICPGCKNLGNRQFLTTEDKLWKCDYCFTEANRLPDEIKILKDKPKKLKQDRQNILLFESRLRMHRAFAVHSRKGYRCMDCVRFIPESLNGEFGISCPYADCKFFGKIEELELMIHPVGMAQRSMLSLNQKSNAKEGKSSSEWQDFVESDNINPDIHMEIHETFKFEFDQLNEVISEQIKSVKRINSAGTLMQKLVMYEAYQKMLIEYPEEMVSYLVHRKQASDFPIQARIFQEYAKMMQESLPYTIIRGEDRYDVCSLTDPNIQLFTGVSEFEATIRDDYSIPNNTVERYIGGLKFKDYGPCFIGMLIDIVDIKNKKSLINNVKNYTFCEINMNTKEVELGTKVLVKHFRIPSHYETFGLVYLQRTRKKIVDSVYYRLNHKKRIAGKNI